MICKVGVQLPQIFKILIKQKKNKHELFFKLRLMLYMTNYIQQFALLR